MIYVVWKGEGPCWSKYAKRTEGHLGRTSWWLSESIHILEKVWMWAPSMGRALSRPLKFLHIMRDPNPKIIDTKNLWGWLRAQWIICIWKSIFFKFVMLPLYTIQSLYTPHKKWGGSQDLNLKFFHFIPSTLALKQVWWKSETCCVRPYGEVHESYKNWLLISWIYWKSKFPDFYFPE